MTDTPAAAVTPHPVPDPLGVNRFDADPVLALAQSADKHPPTLEHRMRSGMDARRINQHPDDVALERVFFSDDGAAAMLHRGACWAGRRACQRRPSTR